MEAKSAESHEVEFEPVARRAVCQLLDVRPCRMLAAPANEAVVRLHAGSPGPSIQRAEVLTDGFLGLAALSQNQRGLAA